MGAQASMKSSWNCEPPSTNSIRRSSTMSSTAWVGGSCGRFRSGNPRHPGRAHMIVLAPTAGGKTEAAFLPVVSRMLSEGWTGLSVLYICPSRPFSTTSMCGFSGTARSWAGGRPSGMATYDHGPAAGSPGPARLPADDARVAGGDARLAKRRCPRPFLATCGR